MPSADTPPACRLCGATNISMQELAPDGTQTLKCSSCGLTFLHPVPAPQQIHCQYDAAYYTPWINAQAGARTKLWERRAKLLASLKKAGKLLDIGCGDGSFLHTAKGLGWDVCGTEVSQWACEHISKRGLTVRHGELLELELPRAEYDAVTLWHVLEHVRDPLATLRKAHSLLKPDGVLVIAVPNAANYLTRAAYAMVKMRTLKFYTPGERELHLFNFSESNLLGFLDKAGFRPVSAGIDKSATRFGEKILETAAVALKAATGLNYSQALQIVSVKKQ
ncbi:MAG: class I SAM-dependent methyltransferase [Elusimicrobia bacterium]|nr:class I SAM-dependent methyltransferase [Elusimicrobiota bacterium]